MLNDKLRPRVNRVTAVVGSRISVNPDVVTLAGLLVSFFAGGFFAVGSLMGGVVFILVSGACDVVDGAVARGNDCVSSFGGFLDSVCDRFADAAVLVGLMCGGFIDPVLGVLAVHSSVCVSYARARAENEGVRCSVGILERAERLLLIIIGATFSAFLGNSGVMSAAVLVLVVLSYVTVLQRVYHTWINLN